MSNVQACRVQLGEDEFAVIAVSMGELTELRDLTAAELEVVDYLLQGASSNTIAQCRGTATRTVANQIASIYRKLGLSSRAELLASIMGGRFGAIEDAAAATTNNSDS